MPSQPADNTPHISAAAAVLLAVAVLAGTILTGLIAAQAVTGIKVYVGTAGFLGGIMSVGGLGFIIQLAAERIMRRLDHLDEQVAVQRVTYLPQQSKQNQGVRFLPAAQGAQGSVGLDPASIAAAKALARRIVDGPAEARSDAE